MRNFNMEKGGFSYSGKIIFPFSVFSSMSCCVSFSSAVCSPPVLYGL